MQKQSSAWENKMSGFSSVSEDIVQNILSRLPALSFSSAACVSKSWNQVCGRIMSKPKLASALSLKPSLHDAVKEVLDKVLSKPIIPHFAIACIGKQFNLEEAHRLVGERLGSGVPIITDVAGGIIGMDACTDQLKEVNWEQKDENDSNSREHNPIDQGIVLVVGFVPGLKVDAIPLLRPKMIHHPPLIDKFVMDIRNYTASVSDCTFPAAIMLFGDKNINMKPVLAKMDCAMPEETAIVGDASGCFLFSSGDGSENNHGNMHFIDAVALVFARDRDNSHGVGETQFHVTLSTGVMPFGPHLQAVCVIAKDSDRSWLTARMEGQQGILDGKDLLEDINDQFDDGESHDLFIGVIKQRECSNDFQNLRSETSLAFYPVLGGDEAFFLVNGVGIKPGDSFLFYQSDSDTASSSCDNACQDLAILKAGSKSRNQLLSKDAAIEEDGHSQEVFGGFIFSCYKRGESFFRHPNVDSFPFSRNFPGVPVGGAFCGGEIGRVSSNSMNQEEDEDAPSCCLHVYSTVYMVMSYVSAPSQ